MIKRGTQIKKIITIMLHNRGKEWFMAGDFQEPAISISNPLFVGWEASARMTDLRNTYPEMVESKKQGKYRWLKFRYDNTVAMFKTLPPEWISFLKSEFEANGITYKIERKTYEPGVDNTMREVIKVVEIREGQVINS